ncbi:hypothetical protein [Sulfobacillus harzensis]|uniref:Uncharacterized protein n=1 Tax=Sulfobacillus harzensis TaxID=2729629 RepID=A0A7Y0L487_9FIRM|nr:hypothetical protein [Sulfobacillus harzensis]NMP22110.1 hypothetical protein [Sulfobacillus harzensis]
MADNQNPKKTIRELTQEKFQEEVARELGIDLNNAAFPERDIRRLENTLHAGDDDSDS